MFFFLSKTLYYLVLPFSWVFILVMASFLIRNNKLKRKLRIASVAMFLLFSNPYLAQFALSRLETNPTLITGKKFDIGIVLSGMIEGGYKNDGQDQLNENFDRLMEAVKLYKNGTISKILISGGSADIVHPEFNEGESLVKLTQIMGVPPEDIRWENQSRNTYENAMHTAELIGQSDETNLLITSAFHMKRASACFKKTGIEFTVYPVDYKARIKFQWKYLFPSSDAFQTWNTVTKELTGLLVYRLVGYI